MKLTSRLKRASTLFIFLAFLLSTVCPAFAASADTFSKACELEKNSSYFKAVKMYERAAREAGRENNDDILVKSNHRLKQIEKIFVTYPYGEAEAKKLAARSFRAFGDGERESWFKTGKINDFILIDGKPYYQQNFIANVLFRDDDIYKKVDKSKSKPCEALYDIIFRPSGKSVCTPPSITNINPVDYLGVQTLKVPRGKLPKTGLLQMWFPMPILSSAQADVRFISFSPQKYLKSLPKPDTDISLAYFEVPLAELKEDLDIEIKFMYKRYEQRFVIDPANCGEYDVESPLYKKYTRDNKNTAVTPEIKAKALEITAGEKNPYLAARKIYFYVLDNIKYSLMPHLALGVTGMPESVYVHQRGYGDCGAQSMYFAALCRAVGIPAKSSGGYQLIPGIAGPHFWAEFYLPNYGWVPVDTSVAQIIDRSYGATTTQKKLFKEYFFGNMDPYRYNIQRETDAALSPVSEDPVFLPLAVQMPVVNLKGSRTNMEFTLLEYWKQNIEPVY
ncbi:MAG: Transglutaminase-like superfamily protein [bacterium ADurb.Bin243]|nr:MAG: Transglutaminase-like superfamily protein [bacterium ADurb.Bin243]